jgi:VanZ family protein
MQTDGRRAKETAFSRVYRRYRSSVLAAATAAYTALLVAATHYPKPERLLGRNPPSDKLLHFMAYGVLGGLAAAALRSRGRWSGRTIAVLAGGLALFAALDEVTQPFFARAADPLDWVFDCIGIAGGILLVVTISSLVSARGSR